MRLCGWCNGTIEPTMRKDSKFCHKRCRQAAWRFGRQVKRAEEAEQPMRLAYADPPYPGLAHYYLGHPDHAGEVDHFRLLEQLATYDGWALSTSSKALPSVLGMASSLELDVRVGSWVRGSRGCRSFGPLQSWEPVIYSGGRLDPDRKSVDDSLVFPSRPRTSDPKRVIGAKPAAFASWMFGLLGAARGDTLDDLFPGSGGIARAWALFQGEGEQ